MGLGADGLGQSRLHHDRRGGTVSDFLRPVLGRGAARHHLDVLSRAHQLQRQLARDAARAVAGCAGRPPRQQEALVRRVHRARVPRHRAAGADRRAATGVSALVVFGLGSVGFWAGSSFQDALIMQVAEPQRESIASRRSALRSAIWAADCCSCSTCCWCSIPHWFQLRRCRGRDAGRISRCGAVVAAVLAAAVPLRARAPRARAESSRLA